MGNYAKSSLSGKRCVLGELKEEAGTLEIICTVYLVTEKELWAPGTSISSGNP